MEISPWWPTKLAPGVRYKHLHPLDLDYHTQDTTKTGVLGTPLTWGFVCRRCSKLLQPLLQILRNCTLLIHIRAGISHPHLEITVPVLALGFFERHLHRLILLLFSRRGRPLLSGRDAEPAFPRAPKPDQRCLFPFSNKFCTSCFFASGTSSSIKRSTSGLKMGSDSESTTMLRYFSQI